MTEVIEHFSEISDDYDALFCDLWGCVHNGIRPFPGAVSALRRYRENGGRVILLTNAPRPRSAVRNMLSRIGLPDECWDDIVTSGDAAQAGLVAGMIGRKVYHLGPKKDAGFFTDMAKDLVHEVEIELVPLSEAEGIACTGLFDDENETPEDYRATILYGVNKGLPLLCANPDIVVDYGDKRLFCAGALAEAYTEAGGEAIYFGKPHAPIYDLSRKRLTAITGAAVDNGRILCIGDGVRTDVLGALNESMDCLFISGGLAAAETGSHNGQPDPHLLEEFLAAHQVSSRYAMARLQ